MGRRVQRHYKMPEQDILLVPLLEGTDGVKKMSKSYGNYIALDEAPNVMFEKTMRLPDNLITKYFLLCTDKSEKEIQKIKKGVECGELNPRDAKADLAREIITLYHGRKTAQKAEKEFNRVFKEKELPAKIPALTIKEKSLALSDLLVKTKLASSKSEAKRLIEQGGVKIDGETQKDWKKQIEIKKGMVIQAGKRKFVSIYQP
jgi:tyrosyl-tRNA synthetase